MHSRNKHRNGYDFNALCTTLPELANHLINTVKGNTSIDFSNRESLICLNKALLMHYYDVKYWALPKDFLCPPVPGRADYIHALADLLHANEQEVTQSSAVKVLDIGTGANLIYPLIGHAEYQWQFSASDINPEALKCAKAIAQANALDIRLQQQPNTEHIFHNVIKPGQYFNLTMCNPPFHANQKEAELGTRRKWQNLKQKPTSKLNFGGQSQELWCDGGEKRFIKTMIRESKDYADQVGWFTCLVSNKENLSSLKLTLKKQQPKKIKTVKMTQGQKISRFLAWSY
ncbi:MULTISPECIES: 23S rRNA (adenine(1618)-N(6))-methyltransferase RlmF [Pseudoalteromonas]|uniref:Ribosomal RNA large subunit methyltransferase F n=1 Tax=Pseudoalteromonas amylolytica TaxID=1859457 RepID=A0A1S1N397_9GAMM|nr:MULTISPECIES: 23S rRNA (adenine(1618)-N(6))-methyltransferase RlmF [Pseudoalteromonas]OHU85545.1 23S rRNA (adenine(1618)-N(6))-methyltransferase [Pseudoalteromonas sp. JW3]OHU93096.1 23S rRNA (adenine(1618)-N(6))-methyltransferase [Pseudoalteromonas amylolytica]